MIYWIYAKIGEPLWQWNGCSDQSVMFYEYSGPFTQSGFPPISDPEWERLQKSNRNS